MEQGDFIHFKNLREDVVNRNNIKVLVEKADGSTLEFETKHSLSDRQITVLAKGGIINDFRTKL
jgi:aconitate hydratase